jgi:hypothetical protein
MWWRWPASEEAVSMVSADTSRTLADLWRDEQLPIEDALYLADGTAYDVEVSPQAPGGFEIGDQFDLAELVRADEDWMASIDPMREVELPGGAGYLCSGEGSHGSDGFFARLDSAGNPIWVLFLTEHNPFMDISIEGTRATFTSTSGVSLTLDIDHPEAGGTR